MWRLPGGTLPQVLLQQLERAAGWAGAHAAQAAALSTGAPAESLWQQTLRAAAAAMRADGPRAPPGPAPALDATTPVPRPCSQQSADAWAPTPEARRSSTAADGGGEAGTQPGGVTDLLARLEQAAAGSAGGDDAAGSAEAVPSSWEPETRRRRRSRPRREARTAGKHAAAAPSAAEPDAATSVLPARGDTAEPLGREPPAEPPAEAATDARCGGAALDAAAGAAGGTLPPALVLQDDAHPIRDADISRAAWHVLTRLRSAGHEAYVVGGTLRDLLLGGTPKDHDLLTSAELHQIRRLFSRSQIVGRSFPVCHVRVEGVAIEVSSFSTGTDPRLIPADASVHLVGRQKPAQRLAAREGAPTWAAARAANAARRDFTVNGLLYDPFSRLLFDCVGGVADCAARRLRTIAPPDESFSADPARILRAVRLAARAGLQLDGAVAEAAQRQAAGLAQLPQGRLQMEAASLLGYGAAAASLALTWRLGLLDLLLPQHARYLRRHRVPRAPRPPGRRRPRPELLFELAAELDGRVSPQRPVDPAVWLALLAAPLVAERCAAVRERLQRRQRRREAGEGRRREGAAAEGRQPREPDPAGYDSSADSDGGSLLGAGDGDARPEGAAAARRRYLERYSQVVGEVLEGMQQGADAALLDELAGPAWSGGEQPPAGAGGGLRRRRRRPARGGGEPGGGAVLPCVLPKAALDRAGALLLLEADLRGHSELRALLGSGPDGGGGDVAPVPTPVAAPEQAQEAAAAPPEAAVEGRHAEQHRLWQRLEQAVRAVGRAEPAPALGAPAGAEAEARLRRRRLGRRLSFEERLVLSILSDPRFDFAARTALPPE